MTRSFIPLFQAIANAADESELRSTIMTQLPEYFDVQRWGIYLLNQEKQLSSVDVVGVTDTFVTRYESVGRPVDKVLDYVLAHHTPAHEGLVYLAGTWKQSELYRRCCSGQNHEHILTGPIVGRGELIGTIHMARVQDTAAFNYQDLSQLGAVCTHLSACLEHLKQSKRLIPNVYLQRLTPRELQIADLVATGLTNRDIGGELWITQNSVKQALKRMFRKLEVSSRTEMVAKLRDSIVE